MTAQAQAPSPPPPRPRAGWPTTTTATPAGHLVCDTQGRVCWTDDLAAATLASAQVLLLQGDGRLGVRSHRLGLLALRRAMRLAGLGTPAVPVTLRHDRHALLIGVHALPDAADGSPRVLLSLRPQDSPFPPDPLPWLHLPQRPQQPPAPHDPHADCKE